MCGSESIVDIEPVAQFCELVSKVIVVLFFFFMKAQVLEQEHVAILHCGDFGFRLIPDTVVCEEDGLVK